MEGHRNCPVAPRPVPLSVPGSLRVERCYALLGKGGRDDAPAGRVELVLLDEERDVRNALGWRFAAHAYAADGLERELRWHVLGWRMADGSRPLGDYDLVDPDLATIERLPVAEPTCSAGGEDARPQLAT